MKNRKFGDINDYRKYGILRLLAGNGETRIGVCWMLGGPEQLPDGIGTEYLTDPLINAFRRYDPTLYDFMKSKIYGKETDTKSRDVRHFDSSQLPGGSFWTNELTDSLEQRDEYFNSMWSRFAEQKIELIYFDPDDGLANNNSLLPPIRKGDLNSSKKLFRDELRSTLEKGFSVLIRHTIKRMRREDLVARLGRELAMMTKSSITFSFWTFNEVFLLIPHPNHLEKLSVAVERIRESEWAAYVGGGKRKGKRRVRCAFKKGFKQIDVEEHHAINSPTKD